MAMVGRVSEDSSRCNARVLVTPRGEVLEACIASRPVFRVGAFEAVKASKPRPARKAPSPEDQAKNRRRSAYRAKKKIFQICACNDFDLFFTLTLAPEKVNRYDYKKIMLKVNRWLDNRVRRKDLKYVMVAEHHKDGAIHFHGLCNMEALDLSFSGLYDKKGRELWNVKDWKLGFSSAVELQGEYMAVCHYISKYITKQTAEKVGGRYYLHGGKLDGPRAVYAWAGSTYGPPERPVKELHLNEVSLSLRYFSVKNLDLFAKEVREWHCATPLIPIREIAGSMDRSISSPFVKKPGLHSYLEQLVRNWNEPESWTKRPETDGKEGAGSEQHGMATRADEIQCSFFCPTIP